MTVSSFGISRVNRHNLRVTPVPILRTCFTLNCHACGFSVAGSDSQKNQSTAWSSSRKSPETPGPRNRCGSNSLALGFQVKTLNIYAYFVAKVRRLRLNSGNGIPIAIEYRCCKSLYLKENGSCYACSQCLCCFFVSHSVQFLGRTSTTFE